MRTGSCRVMPAMCAALRPHCSGGDTGSPPGGAAAEREMGCAGRNLRAVVEAEARLGRMLLDHDVVAGRAVAAGRRAGA